MRCKAPALRSMLAAALLCAAAAAAAAADDAAATLANMARAQAAVTSFRLESVSQLGTTTMTFVKPGRLHVETKLPTGMTQQTYLVDGAFYISFNGQWQRAVLDKAQLPADAVQAQPPLTSPDAKVQLEPDRTVEGVRLGVVRYEAKFPNVPFFNALAPQTFTCTFDKTTYLQRTCMTTMGTVEVTTTFSHYNDPANAFEVPPEAKNAPPLAIPFAAPSPAPSAVPSSQPR